MPEYPLRIETGGTGPTPNSPESVSEKFATVGEVPEQAPLEGLRTILYTTRPLLIAADLPASVFGTDYGFIAAAQPVWVRRGQFLTVTVHYTPGVDGAQPYFFEEVNNGSLEEGLAQWAPKKNYSKSVAPLSGAGFSAGGYFANGNRMRAPFNGDVMTVAGAPYAALLEEDTPIHSAHFKRWRVLDSDLTTPGTVSIEVTVG